MSRGDGKGVSRRDLLTFWRRPIAELRKPPAPAPSPGAVRPPPLRPPGMMSEELLVNSCIRCGRCVEACPADAIFPLGEDWGRAFGTPAIDARTRPCVVCTGLQCTHVCPSGALQPVYNERDVAMGTARLEEASCLSYRGEPCKACVLVCPIHEAIAVGEGGYVRVNAAACIGCGLCEQACPTQPTSIRIVPRG